MYQHMIRLARGPLQEPSSVDGDHGIIAGERMYKGSIHMMVGSVVACAPTSGASVNMITESYDEVSKLLYRRGAL
jgi:hypothetical protein